MANNKPSKVTLNSTTKLSLNDRFSAYRQSNVSMANVRLKMQQTRQASARNQRLAQQMENRPSVIAALKLKKKSLKQRLGPTGQATFRMRGTAGRYRGFRSMRGNGNLRQFRGRGARRGVKMGMRRGFQRQAAFVSPMMNARIGSQTNLSQRGRGMRGMQRGMRRGQGVGRGFGGNFRGNFSGAVSRSNRGAVRGRMSRGSRGRNRGAVQNLPTKQELDSQLDEYMSKTKSHLDAELDAYMAQGHE